MAKKIPKFFLAALCVNLSLLMAYVVLNLDELSNLLVLDSVVAVDWNPFMTSIAISHVAPGVIGDGLIWWGNNSFFAVLALVFGNLFVIWWMERKMLRQANAS